MPLFLKRQYFPNGTNGNLWCDKQLVCHTIELPWRNNERNISCIPEGKYRLKRRFTKKRGWHYILEGVPDRSFILFHPANNALKELRGCIAPVSELTGEGTGADSRRANASLSFVIDQMMKEGEVYITINS